VIISVKSGGVTASQFRDLLGVVSRERAALGVLVTLKPPTRAMREDAATAGFFKSDGGRHPKLQILTVEVVRRQKDRLPASQRRDDVQARAKNPREGRDDD
jgi:site-specific DNA-methyltransferase (adenine-specific)